MYSFVFANKVGCVTGRDLAKKITKLQGSRCRFYCKNHPARTNVPHIRWGVTPATNELHCVNSLLTVQLAASKLASLKKMVEAGVSCVSPVERSKISEIRRVIPNAPLIFRKSHRHAGNDDPYIVQSSEEIDMARAKGYDYGIEFIPAWAEYRVHVCNGKVIRVQRKRRKRGEEHDDNIRSESRGWVLVEEEDPRFNSEEFTKPAVDAVTALELDFGAVDVLRARKGKKSVVIEVNTAPGLNEDGIERYAKALLAMQE